MSDLAQASGSSAPTDLERKNPTAPSPVQPEEIPSVSSDLLPGGFHRYRPNFDTEITTETNLRRPLTDLVITVRVIKSFAFRSMKHLVLQGVDGTVETVGGLKGRCLKEISTQPAFKPFRSFAPKLDTLKLYTRAHGSKTTNLIINLDHPEWIYDDESKTLAELGIENETELSLFNREDYEHFLTDPQVRWDGDGGSSG
ncbi:unnamed protein product [Tilletia controversa]|uniref:Cytoplasmic protein n=2 Tax=Tilletia TaxID=13289 RepID=A0A8X7MY81_9BASI|nr:hypothetical protein CF336_g6101 [Tilletia laevis]KAE8191551.1 hypothetical protein CF328_g5647 [Tilletia controversa]KAE8256500.1 hypothetical protein A4X03_0g5345 [Tilletia caries]KAE8194689.1 hypothetical protein CF335_g5284 [Tilletia laevis]KAE8252538.1 hypothetical protein A4X06_0g2112 [Tilletia controversa]